MKKVSLMSDNSYAQEFDKFTDSKLFSRLSEKYRIRPYYEENAKLRLLAYTSSYLFNILSIALAFYFVYSLFISVLSHFYAIALSMPILILIEALKRLILPNVFRRYFQFSSYSVINIFFVLVLIVLSAFISSKGSLEITYQNSYTPISKTDSINLIYSNLIEAKEEEQKGYKKQTWKGKTTRTAQKIIEGIQSEINSIRLSWSNDLEEERQRHEEEELKAEEEEQHNGFYLALLAVLMDLCLLVSLAYCEYYDYRSIAEFATIAQIKDNQNDSDTDSMSTTKTLKQTDNKRITEEAPLNELIDKKRICLNCADSFNITHPKKKFCSSKCRVEHWQKKNNKVLTVPT